MTLFDNPFYILSATPHDNRHKILSLTNEKALLVNTEVYQEASNALLMPQRRLSAEINWFTGCNNEVVDEIVNYISGLRSNEQSDELVINDISLLTQINLNRYTFAYIRTDDVYRVKYIILEISRLFKALDSNDILRDINNARSISGFPLLTSTTEIDVELRNIRNDLRQLISKRLKDLPIDLSCDLCTMIAEKYVSDDRYSGSAIIEDSLSEYALNLNSNMQDQKQQIISMVEHIRINADRTNPDEKVNDLIRLILQWDRLAQPLQLESKAKGINHTDSKELAIAIRNLAVDLHNSYGLTSTSLKLTTVLKEAFAELPDFAERIGEDANTLRHLKEEMDEEDREKIEVLRRNRMDKEYWITLNTNRIILPQFCTCCLEPTKKTERVTHSMTQQNGTTKTTRTVSLDFPLCDSCLGHRKRVSLHRFIILIISVAIGIFAMYLLVSVALTDKWLSGFISCSIAAIIFGLLGSIINGPALSGEHSTVEHSIEMFVNDMTGNKTLYTFTNWRYAKMFAQANNGIIEEKNRRNRAKNKTLIKSFDRPVKPFFIMIIILTVIFLFIGDAFLTDSTQVNSQSYNSQSRVKSDNNDSSYVDTYEEDMEERLAQIEDMEDELDKLEGQADYYETQYNETKNNKYVDLYNEIVDKYNDLWEEYSNAVDEYNSLID